MHSSGVGLLAVLVLVVAVRAADDRVLAAERLPVIGVPQNMTATDEVQRRIAGLLQKSPTLRRQCERIAGAAQMHIAIRLNLHPHVDTARTTFRRYRSGAVLADVEVPSNIFFPELLAHELEHVLEQIEGVDLRQLAAATRSRAARQDEHGVFESERARAAGRAAADELYGTDLPGFGATGRGVVRAARAFWRMLTAPAFASRTVR